MNEDTTTEIAAYLNAFFLGLETGNTNTTKALALFNRDLLKSYIPVHAFLIIMHVLQTLFK